MKTVMIINKDLPRKEIIKDIAKEAKEICGYNRDNVLKRCMLGIIDFKEDKFYGMLRKIIKQELPSIQEIMIMKNDTFEKYMNL
jgi:hypothetical protein